MIRRNLKAPRAWLEILSVRIATRVGDKEAVKRVRMGLALIAMGLPDAAFIQDTADAVMAETVKEPSASDIRAAVVRWWDANAPEEPDTMPRDIAASGLAVGDQLWAKLFRLSTYDQEATRLGLIRIHAPQAFTWLWENDATAVSVATRRGWAPVSQAARYAEWGEPANVRRAIDAAFGVLPDGTRTWPEDASIGQALMLLRALLTRWAPHNLSMVPEGPAWSPNRVRGGGPRPVSMTIDA